MWIVLNCCFAFRQDSSSPLKFCLFWSNLSQSNLNKVFALVGFFFLGCFYLMTKRTNQRKTAFFLYFLSDKFWRLKKRSLRMCFASRGTLMKKTIPILLNLFASANGHKEVNFMLFQVLTLELLYVNTESINICGWRTQEQIESCKMLILVKESQKRSVLERFRSPFAVARNLMRFFYSFQKKKNNSRIMKICI